MRDLSKLFAFIEGRARTPFAWGRARNDCISYALGAVRAQTGTDLLKGSGLRWRSEAGARRALKGEGGLLRAVSRRLPKIAPAAARRGDIGLVKDMAGRRSLVVIEGETVVGPGPAGEVRQPRAALERAWSLKGVAGED